MSENSRRKLNQNLRQTEEFGKSRDYLNQPKGKSEDSFRTSESDRGPSKPPNAERLPKNNRSGYVTPSHTEAPADE